MVCITDVHAFEILDSRGNPTIRTKVVLSNGVSGIASVPSGASTGTHEAFELRDGDKKRFHGKGVRKAIHNVNTTIAKVLIGQNPLDQALIDQTMIDADATPNKAALGANAILSASLATAVASATYMQMPLFRYIAGLNPVSLPVPMMNIINGGKHADNSLDFQEFMIRPHGFNAFPDMVQAGVEVFHTLKQLLKEKKFATAVGDEGGFAPDLASHEQAIELIIEAITKAGYKVGKEISIAIDCASSELYDPKENVYFELKKKNGISRFAAVVAMKMIGYLEQLVTTYPIDSIEDGLHENDWSGWERLTKALSKKIQIVGDDIFVTNPIFLERGIKQGVANAILIKPNQIGTLIETIRTIQIAKESGYKTILSHRSGETADTTIADIAVGMNAGQIKTGSLSRSDRVEKYNRLLEIAELLEAENKRK